MAFGRRGDLGKGPEKYDGLGSWVAVGRGVGGSIVYLASFLIQIHANKQYIEWVIDFYFLHAELSSSFGLLRFLLFPFIKFLRIFHRVHNLECVLDEVRVLSPESLYVRTISSRFSLPPPTLVDEIFLCSFLQAKLVLFLCAVRSYYTVIHHKIRHYVPVS